MTLDPASMDWTSPTDGTAGLFSGRLRRSAAVRGGGRGEPHGRVPGVGDGDMGGAKNHLSAGLFYVELLTQILCDVAR